MKELISTRGIRGAMVACAALTLAASTVPVFAASPHATGWSESRVTRSDAALFASTRPEAGTTWVAGTRFVPTGDDSYELVPTLWERDERKGSGWRRVKTAPVPRGDDVRFNDVDASSPRNGLVVGDYVRRLGGMATQAWNGNVWKPAVAPVPHGVRDAGLVSVDTRASRDAWGAGYAYLRTEGGSSMVGLLQHWDGTRWKAQKLPDIAEGDTDVWWQLSDVTALAADDVWAVGNTSSRKASEPVLLHYDGTRWNKVAVPEVGTTRTELREAVAGPDGHVWVVGQTQAPDKSWQGLALHYDGKKWTNVPVPKGTGALTSVAISQGDPVVLEETAEDTSAVLRYSGGKWVSMKLPAGGAKPYSAMDISVSGRTIDVVGDRPGTATQEVGPGSLLTTRQ